MEKDTNQMKRQIIVEFDHTSSRAKRGDRAVVSPDLCKGTYTRKEEGYPQNIRLTAEGDYCKNVNGTLI